MAHIVIKDIPAEMKISAEELKGTSGGFRAKRIRSIKYDSLKSPWLDPNWKRVISLFGRDNPNGG